MDLKNLKLEGIPEIDEKKEQPKKAFKGVDMKEMEQFMTITDKGTNMARQGRYDEAIKFYDQALEIMPRAWYTLVLKANVLLQARKDDEVIETTNQLCHYFPYKADGWFIRGLALINVGRPDDGLRCLQNALKIDPRMKPAQDAIDRLFRTHPNNFEHILPRLKEPIRRTYELIYRIFEKISPDEWISFRVVEFTFAGFVEEFVKKQYDMEFKQTEFKEYLPKLMYPIIKQDGLFIAYVGKLAATAKNTLFLGLGVERLDDLTYLKYSCNNKGGFEIYPFYEEIVDEYEKIQREWKNIWDKAMKIPLRVFYNLELLEQYLESLKTDLV